MHVRRDAGARRREDAIAPRAQAFADPRVRQAIASTTLLVVSAAALEATVAYRAATQSITYDEAMAYLKFLRGSLSDVFTHYDASNHVLFTVFARLSIAVFGLSELSLRLPSVAGAAAFFIALVLVCRRLFGRGVMPVVAAALVALNPFVLDAMSAARGYGLAFSLLTVALYFLTLALDDDLARRRWRWGAASVALGLSASANLTFAVPAVALVITAALTRTTSTGGVSRRWIRDRLWLAVPGMVVASAILAVPLYHAPPAPFFFGADRIAASVASVIRPAFHYRAPAWACGAAGPNEYVPPLAAGVCAAAALLLGIAACIAWRRAAADREAPALLVRFTLLCGGSLLLTLAQVFVMHAAFGLRYPQGRTGLYLLLLFPLATASGVALLRQSPGTKMIGRAGALLLAGVSLWFVSQFSVTHFYEWRFDAGTRRIVEMLVERAERSGRQLRVWAHDLEPSISFYRLVRAPHLIARMPEAGAPPGQAYDFLVACSPPERRAAMRSGTAIYVDPVSAAVLVERP